MSLIPAIRNRLLSRNALTDLVGARIRRKRLRRGDTLPAVLLRAIGDARPLETHTGSSGLFESRIQFTVVAQDIADGQSGIEQCGAVETAVHEALKGIRGQTVWCFLHAAFRQSSMDDEDTDAELDFKVFDYKFWWSE